jgi:hypothetical protein
MNLNEEMKSYLEKVNENSDRNNSGMIANAKKIASKLPGSDRVKRIYRQIVKNGYLEDRLEYSREDLKSAYDLNSEETNQLYNLIQGEQNGLLETAKNVKKSSKELMTPYPSKSKEIFSPFSKKLREAFEDELKKTA